MYYSRGLHFLRMSSALVKTIRTPQNRFRFNLNQQIRKSSHDSENKWYYREYPEYDKTSVKWSEFLSSFVWWWILWHLFTDYDEIILQSLPDPSEWTDEELGVPPDDEEDV